MGRFTQDDIVGAAGVDKDRNWAMPFVDGRGVYDLSEHDAARFANTSVEDFQLAGLRPAAESGDSPD